MSAWRPKRTTSKDSPGKISDLQWQHFMIISAITVLQNTGWHFYTVEIEPSVPLMCCECLSLSTDLFSWWRKLWLKRKTKPSSLWRPRSVVMILPGEWGGTGEELLITRWHNMLTVVMGRIMPILDRQKVFTNIAKLQFSVLGGQPCVSMETRASQKETGYSQVRIDLIQCCFCPSLCWRSLSCLNWWSGLE